MLQEFFTCFTKKDKLRVAKHENGTLTVRLGSVGVAFVELRTTASAEKSNCTKGGLQVLCFNKMVMQLVQCKLCSDEFHH